MNIHEYQAKEILSRYQVDVPRGKVAFSADEAVKAAQELGSDICVVKAQIHAGGRGKAGGVKLAKSVDEVKQIAEQLIGMTLVTHQTGPEGKEVKRLLIEEGIDIAEPGFGLERSVIYFRPEATRPVNKVRFRADETALTHMRLYRG